MSDSKVNVHIGDIKSMGRRFVRAWQGIQDGKRIYERHVTFGDFERLLSALSPKRRELLHKVHEQPANNTRTLALRLGRDYRQVYDDVETLEAAGLLQREDDGRLTAPFDVIQLSAEMRL